MIPPHEAIRCIDIMLVIIGLIAGGVVAGQELIEQAEVKGTIARIDEYRTAINTFRLQYESYPGDFDKSLPPTIRENRAYFNGLLDFREAVATMQTRY